MLVIYSRCLTRTPSVSCVRLGAFERCTVRFLVLLVLLLLLLLLFLVVVLAGH
jgi:hypothetical protein